MYMYIDGSSNINRVKGRGEIHVLDLIGQITDIDNLRRKAELCHGSNNLLKKGGIKANLTLYATMIRRRTTRSEPEPMKYEYDTCGRKISSKIRLIVSHV